MGPTYLDKVRLLVWGSVRSLGVQAGPLLGDMVPAQAIWRREQSRLDTTSGDLLPPSR
jgi:hypothetical protein